MKNALPRPVFALLGLFVLILLVTGTTGIVSAQTRYTIQSGDTLSGIAEKYGVSFNCLAIANNITNADIIYPGQVLTIPDSFECSRYPTGPSSASGMNVVYYPGYPTSPYFLPPTYYYANQPYISPVYYNSPRYYPRPTYYGRYPRGGCYHRVGAGENLFRIGVRYGTSYWNLAVANGLPNPNAVFAGQILFIPGCN